MVRRHVRYEGHVQGVGFRATAAALARRRPVSGWVRNEPDGSVTLKAQGEESQLEGLLMEIRGSMGRRIRSEVQTPLDPDPCEAGFVIRP